MRAVLVVSAMLACGLAASPARADDLGVTRVEVEERQDGTIEVFARVPLRLASFLAPPELRGRGVFESAGYVRVSGGGVRFRFEQGERRLASGDVLVLPWQRQAALARVRLSDGATARKFFRRTGRGIEIPVDAVRRAEPGLWERAQSATLDGIRHVTTGWAHLVLILLLGLTAGLRRGATLVGAFLLGQLIAVLVAALSGVLLSPGLGEVALVLAVAFAAREALRRDGVDASLGPILACAGLVHGLGLASVVLPAGDVAELVLVVLGIDGAQLLGVVAVSGAAAALRGRHGAGVLHVGVAYVAGVASVAVIALFLLGDGRAAAWSASSTPRAGSAADEEGDLRAASRSRSGPGSQALTPQRVEAPVQSFLTIEPFEIRHDVLLRLKDLASWTQLPTTSDDAWIEIAAQPGLLRRLGERVVSSTRLTLDGSVVTPIVDRVDFVTVGPKGTFPRTESVRERVAEARVGVVLSALAQGVPNEVALTWTSRPDGAGGIPAAVTDPESSRSLTLPPDEATLRWRNELVEDPVPEVEGIQREPPRLAVPWLALPLFAVALVLLARVLRRRAGRLAVTTVRLALVAALLLAPVAQTAVALPDSWRRTPSSEDARQILGSLLTNVYRSFSFREESDIYDRLARSVAGDQLTKIYLEQSRSLVMAERGGARARVETVEVLEVRSVRNAVAGGFVAEVGWTVGGSVSHFGHRHFRQNRYDARVTVVPDGDLWKIADVEVLDQRRVL